MELMIDGKRKGLVGPDGFPFYLTSDRNDSLFIKYGKHFQIILRFKREGDESDPTALHDNVFAQIKAHLEMKAQRSESRQKGPSFDDACAINDLKTTLLIAPAIPSASGFTSCSCSSSDPFQVVLL